MTDQNEIVLYQPNETLSLEVKLVEDTVWLTQQQIADLFGVKQPAVSKHLKNIFEEGELSKESVHSILEYTAADGKKYQTQFYNLDAILSVGYRVSSKRATQFRQWANKVLRDYLLRGYAINDRLMLMKEEIDYKIAKHEIILQEHQKQIDFFVKTELPPRQGVFMDGQIYDALEMVTRLIKSAKSTIWLIDNYVDDDTLTILSHKVNDVKIEVTTRIKSKQLALAEDKFNEQYGGLSINTSDKVHDRFLILDDNHLYLIGASLKDLGKRLFAFIEMDNTYIEELKRYTNK